MPSPAVLATADKAKKSDAPVMVQANPFVRAANAVTEGAFLDRTTAMSAASTTQVSDTDVPAYGYLRAIRLHVQATGGAAGLATVNDDEDAPWNVLQDITLTDVNGRPLVGPLSGYDLFLANKWAGYSYASNPAAAPSFTAVDTDGDFSFMLTIPVEVSARDGLCALPNQNSSATYKLGYTIAAGSTVYDTAPNTLPSVRVRAYADFWSTVPAADPNGRPNMTAPPAVGSTQHWTKSTPTITSGEQRVRMTRVGNMIRQLIFVLRTSSARSTVDFPDTIRVEVDQRNLMVLSRDILRELMFERSGLTPDTGVLVLDFAWDLDGKTGFEMRDQWLPTTEATRLEVVGSFGNNAANLHVLTNDIAPVGAVHI